MFSETLKDCIWPEYDQKSLKQNFFREFLGKKGDWD